MLAAINHFKAHTPQQLDIYMVNGRYETRTQLTETHHTTKLGYIYTQHIDINDP